MRQDARAFAGEVVVRLRGFGELYLQPVPGVSADFNGIAFGPQGEAVIVGDRGTVLRRPPGAATLFAGRYPASTPGSRRRL